MQSGFDPKELPIVENWGFKTKGADLPRNYTLRLFVDWENEAVDQTPADMVGRTVVSCRNEIDKESGRTVMVLELARKDAQ